jgi:hypothetical protein
MAAVVEGLAGVWVDRPGFGTVHLEPHWDAAGVEDADVSISYAASGEGFHYTYSKKGDSTEIVIKSFPHKAVWVALPMDVKSVDAESRGKKLASYPNRYGYDKKSIGFENVEGEIRLVYKV